MNNKLIITPRGVMCKSQNWIDAVSIKEALKTIAKYAYMLEKEQNATTNKQA